MFASPASHHPHQNPLAAAANGQQQQQQQPQAAQPPLPPPSLREILDAFGKDGNGDREMLMSILSSKRAEEERIASQLNYQTQLFLLAQQYQALQAHALVAQQQQQQQQQRQIGQTTFGTPSPAPSSHQPLPSPSPSHYSECSASSSSSSFSGPTRYSPYARSSGGSDSLAPPFDGQHAFRSEKQARVNSAAKARRARGSSSASSASSTHGSTSTTTVHGTVVAPLASPAQSATSIARDTSMSPPPVPSPTTGAVQSSTAPKRAALSDLLGATTAAYAVSVRETAVQESFLRGGDDASSE